VAAFALGAAQDIRQQDQEKRAAARDQARAEEDAREQTLRDYLRQMSDLMLHTSLRSRGTPERVQMPGDQNAVNVARTLTLTTLRRLDGARKGIVVRFLAESNLITAQFKIAADGVGQQQGDPRISLEGADLRRVVIRGRAGSELIPTSYAPDSTPNGWLMKAIMLKNADLRNADFRGSTAVMRVNSTDAREANFTGADLRGWTLQLSCLTGARFIGAEMGRTNALPGIDLLQAAGSDVDFSRANLSGADLHEATLTNVNLRFAATDGTQFPPKWTSTGIQMSDAAAKRLCGGLGLTTI
jgi:uncharacterized protein YjbI with pentapeptide repeats